MTGPLFTVAIPAYNATRTIETTLDSVAVQTFTDYEIVVTDDGSKDETAQAVERWIIAHPGHQATLVRQTNKGVGGARNSCIRAARGTFVAFLDSDDRWLPTKLERVAAQLRSASEPTLVCHDVWLESPTGERAIKAGPYSSYRELLFRGNCLFTSATCVRRAELVALGGFSENLEYDGVEDWELWLRLARAGARFEYIREVLAAYQAVGGISGNIKMHCDHTVNVLELHFAKWEPKNWYYRYRKHSNLSSLFRWAGNAYRSAGRYDESRKYFARSLRENPLNWKAWILAASVVWA